MLRRYIAATRPLLLSPQRLLLVLFWGRLLSTAQLLVLLVRSLPSPKPLLLLPWLPVSFIPARRMLSTPTIIVTHPTRSHDPHWRSERSTTIIGRAGRTAGPKSGHSEKDPSRS